MSIPIGFHSLTIKEVRRETDLAVTLIFDIPSELQTTFAYKAGQYLTLHATINGEDVRRAYSLCTAPNLDKNLAVTVKAVDKGRMSNYVNSVIKAGDTLAVMPPNGKFIVEPNASASKTYILFGGGSGITPMMGITKTVLAFEPNSKVYLIYANQNQDSVIFKNQLDALEKENKERFKIFYSYDKAPMMWFGLKGFLNEKNISDVLKIKIGGSWAAAEYYICGPSPMMDIVKTSLVNLGIPSPQIHTEYFTATTSAKELKTDNTADQKFSGKAKVKVSVYGATTEIEVKENQTILDAANAAGLQPPYSCTVGVCTTCRAKVTKGKVEMLEREGLSDSEIEEGFVLTCQSIPKSGEIELEYS